MLDLFALYFQGSAESNGGLGVSSETALRCGRFAMRLSTGEFRRRSQYRAAATRARPCAVASCRPGCARISLVSKCCGHCTSATFNLTNGVKRVDAGEERVEDARPSDAFRSRSEYLRLNGVALRDVADRRDRPWLTSMIVEAVYGVVSATATYISSSD